MRPPIYELCSSDTSLQSLIEIDGEFRLYSFGESPEGLQRPYAVWQTIDGEPELYLSNTPDVDSVTILVDVYADTADSSRQIADALRGVIESVAHVVRYNGEWRDPETRAYRCSFTVDWIVNRS